jgi:hypothetical protein
VDAGAKHYWYACKIQETTDGSGGSAGGQAWTAFEIFAPRRIEANVQIDEPEGASPRGQDQAQKVADEKTEAQVSRSPPIIASSAGERNYSG